jgi:hypothetical protein
MQKGVVGMMQRKTQVEENSTEEQAKKQVMSILTGLGLSLAFVSALILVVPWCIGLTFTYFKWVLGVFS